MDWEASVAHAASSGVRGKAIHVSCDVRIDTVPWFLPLVMRRTLDLPERAMRSTFQPSFFKASSAALKRHVLTEIFSGVAETLVISFDPFVFLSKRERREDRTLLGRSQLSQREMEENVERGFRRHDLRAKSNRLGSAPPCPSEQNHGSPASGSIPISASRS